MKKTMNSHLNAKKMLCLTACLLIGVFCYQLVVSRDYSGPSAHQLSAQESLFEERHQILDDLQTLELRIDTLREQLAELEDSLLKKNERLAILEGQIAGVQ